MKDGEALAAALARLPQGGLLFIDEIHAVPRSVLELLHGEMDGGAPRGHAITVLAASTERGKLPDALLSRSGLCESLDFYADEDLARIAGPGSARTPRTPAGAEPTHDHATRRALPHPPGTRADNGSWARGDAPLARPRRASALAALRPALALQSADSG